MREPGRGVFLPARGLSEKIPGKKLLIAQLLTLSGISALMGVIGAAPYFENRGSILGTFFYSLLAPICHQIPARSFYLFGHPMAVCGRCLGVYAGFFLGTILHPLIRGFQCFRPPGRALLIMVSIPIVFDTAANMLKFWSSSNVVRLFLGMSWGAVLPFYFIPAIASIKWSKAERS